jgi:hypothetical protein
VIAYQKAHRAMNLRPGLLANGFQVKSLKAKEERMSLFIVSTMRPDARENSPRVAR